MKIAGVDKAFMIINREKWDIPRYFGSGNEHDISISYLIQENQTGMPDALDLAYPWVKDETVVFGMPDTIFHPEDAYKTLISAHREKKADVTLGVFPTDKSHKFGMVSIDPDGSFSYTVDKPSTTDLKYMWGIGCWEPSFTRLLHQYSRESKNNRETILGDVFNLARNEGLSIRVQVYSAGEYIDIGTLDDLVFMIKYLTAK